MRSRFATALLVALSLLASAVVAQAQMWDPEGRYTGGNPKARGG